MFLTAKSVSSFGLKRQNVSFTSSTVYTKKKPQKNDESFNPATSAKYLIGWQKFVIIRTDENKENCLNLTYWQNK